MSGVALTALRKGRGWPAVFAGVAVAATLVLGIPTPESFGATTLIAYVLNNDDGTMTPIDLATG
jgi:hypothetical protein